MSEKVETVTTSPFAGQKPGTSGLRKKCSEFFQANYVENFVQCTLEAVGGDLEGATLVVGGDGRYGVKDVASKIIQIAAANKVKIIRIHGEKRKKWSCDFPVFQVSKLIVGQDGILSTPAVSNLIRKNATTGGIILTASHNPGGKNGMKPTHRVTCLKISGLIYVFVHSRRLRDQVQHGERRTGAFRFH